MWFLVVKLAWEGDAAPTDVGESFLLPFPAVKQINLDNENKIVILEPRNREGLFRVLNWGGLGNFITKPNPEGGVEDCRPLCKK